ncbi:radical SAM protein [Candidatus Paracaedibacter symbiosus]|uniref:radical SAM protein n=1 Tax=Candidatus Paracaedibacter symbiosus TaxID=244582 RepID=UPI000509EF12|nr:radical SAM protein [Candidatus Paracaedibacter symbiosus]
MTRLSSLTMKVASRCNLNCTYCYVYNAKDDAWRSRPKIMSDIVFLAAIKRLAEHARASNTRPLRIIFHGGEPTLVGSERLARWCEIAREELAEFGVSFGIQTNGTRFTKPLVEVLKKFAFSVGVSIDGPRAIHDRFRVTHAGKGSYGEVFRGLALLREAHVPYAVLSVLNMLTPAKTLYDDIMALKPDAISYLLPDYSHDTFPITCRDGRLGEYLQELFDEWWFQGTMRIPVQPFRAMASLIMGGNSTVDIFGNDPLGFIFIETDGTIEPLDVLKVCENGMTLTPFNVLTNGFEDYTRSNSIGAKATFQGSDLPSACATCPEASTCGGGYLPHRYSRGRGFDNPSIWCRDLKALFSHIRHRLAVPHPETELRRQILRSLHEVKIEV